MEYAFLNINGMNKESLFKLICIEFVLKTIISVVSFTFLYLLAFHTMFS